MSKRDTRPSLTTGNHIYLYRLLSEQLGCGKQTLLPRVEEALASDRMEAADLGFESTRDLLEQLDDFIKLTVFKGGRIYATVIAQPAWDEALAAPEKQQADNSGKPWKRKKADKSLKPVKPRRIKRKAPDDEVAAAAVAASVADDAVDAAGAPSDAAEERGAGTTSDVEMPEGGAASQAAANEAADGGDAAAEAVADGTADAAAIAAAANVAADAADADDAAATEPAAVDAAAEESAAPEDVEDTADAGQTPVETETAQPAISLTVVYDPENANAGMRTLESTPGITSAAAKDTNPDASEPAAEPAGATDAAAENEPARQPVAADEAPAREQQARPKTTSAAATAGAPAPAGADATSPDAEPSLPDDAPVDFACDVYCPADLLAEVSYLLPYGADVLGIMTEYFHIARLRGSLEAARNRLVFPMGYTRDGARHTVVIRLKRNATHGGAPWIVDDIAK